MTVCIHLILVLHVYFIACPYHVRLTNNDQIRRAISCWERHVIGVSHGVGPCLPFWDPCDVCQCDLTQRDTTWRCTQLAKTHYGRTWRRCTVDLNYWTSNIRRHGTTWSIQIFQGEYTRRGIRFSAELMDGAPGWKRLWRQTIRRSYHLSW